MKQSLFLIMGSHLFPIQYIPHLNHKNVLMIEDFELCTHFRYHKKKLVFFLEAMRNYADDLRDQGFKVTYIPLQKESVHKDFALHLLEHLRQLKYKNFESYEIEDRFFRNRLKQLVKQEELNWVTYKSPMFLHSIDDFLMYFSLKKYPRLRSFYEFERRQKNILMQDGNPVGGQFSFDQENRKRLPKTLSIPQLPSIKKTNHHNKVCQVVNDFFFDHPGDTDGCWLPVSQAEAEEWLQIFLQQRLGQFGPYEDAISLEDPFLFHSVLSPLLNIGLLTPKEVIEKALEQENIPMNSIEGFIRQVLGWREFIRGIDECFGEQQEECNFFENKRLLNSVWWTAETGLLPVDHSIKNAIRYGYCHHIERLMILSNVMLLLEVHPKQVYQWFMEMFVDSADWVMGPNVYGMGQFSDGGIFATKPYICGSNYLKKMGNFPKGDWCDILDGLYWKFIDKRRNFFRSQPRLNMMVATLDRMSEKKRKYLFSLAAIFQEKVTRACHQQGT